MSVHPSVRPSDLTSQNLATQNNYLVSIVIAISGIVGLVEGIIDDTCLVFNIYYRMWSNSALLNSGSKNIYVTSIIVANHGRMVTGSFHI